MSPHGGVMVNGGIARMMFGRRAGRNRELQHSCWVLRWR